MKNKNPKSIDIEKKLSKYLEFLLNNKQCVDYLKSSENFQKIIKNELLILNYFLSSKKVKKDNLHDLVDKYNGYCSSNKLNLKDKLAIKDKDEMIDYANYLKIYAKNILHFDLDEALASPDKIQNIKIDNVDSKIINTSVSGTTWENTFNENFRNINPFVLKSAQERIREKLRNDEIFIFKSKPKIVKVMKIAYSCLMFLFTFALLFLAIVWFVVANKPTGIISSNNQNIEFGYWNPIFLIIFSISFAYFGIINIIPYIIAKKAHRKPSENAIYAVISWYVIFSMVFSAIFSIYMVWPVMREKPIFYYIDSYGSDYDDLTKNCVLLMSITTGTMLAISFLCLVVGAIILFFKPKQDEEKIQKLLFDEINNVANEKPIDLTPDKTNTTTSEPKN